uniref:Uncharacterized protein n=1 Tax=Arundo donax TaxID=35708 RepID=A0A0A9G7X1_ARUDO
MTPDRPYVCRRPAKRSSIPPFPHDLRGEKSSLPQDLWHPDHPRSACWFRLLRDGENGNCFDGDHAPPACRHHLLRLL